MGSDIAIRRLDLGTFIRPAAEAGGAAPRVESALAYLVRHDRGLILFDMGIGVADAATEARYRPRRRPLPDALAAAGVSLDEISLVVNCHLHFDHCGGNPLFAGTPVVVQATELATARAGGYTVDELVDFPGVRYEELTGDAEIWPDVWVVATPGHTPGHQSLVVRRPDGGVVLAGQARDRASDYAAEQLAREARAHGAHEPLPAYRPWLDRLADFDPRRVLFAHDCSVWEPAEEGGWPESYAYEAS
ncbi:N-acyl homoserine lactonase family protein [Streptomyces sp. TRM66268-LWL]|uniref:N-acyl homoserine lactonase family protein n=1 Tax=Streptomyces polyasparticus TaxID=2767826 RepID=A0ABR7SDQ0_9ACTN|nr:N-acyl homoserine lactonase family protein [Streptomyces polyasparticus]MBC9713087.1 N-acyl homoserine lactonase family protein [Streptomyces polyasparticus]